MRQADTQWAVSLSSLMKVWFKETSSHSHQRVTQCKCESTASACLRCRVWVGVCAVLLGVWAAVCSLHIAAQDNPAGWALGPCHRQAITFGFAVVDSTACQCFGLLWSKGTHVLLVMSLIRGCDLVPAHLPCCCCCVPVRSRNLSRLVAQCKNHPDSDRSVEALSAASASRPA